MSVLSDLMANVKKVLLIEEKIERQERALETLLRRSDDHDRRLVRIETVMEMSGYPPAPPRLPPE